MSGYHLMLLVSITCLWASCCNGIIVVVGSVVIVVVVIDIVVIDIVVLTNRVCLSCH